MSVLRSCVYSHKPVLLGALLQHIAPVNGTWIDGTFGAGGYSQALLKAGADCVIGIDRDPDVFERAKFLTDKYGDRLKLVQGKFGQIIQIAEKLGYYSVTGVVLDIGVSSMQLDQSHRGFSFQSDGPLDMRMSKSGISASDIVNQVSEQTLADILFYYGEERFSRKIARSIVKERKINPVETTKHLSNIVEKAIPRSRLSVINPSTRTFQALRIAVNDELNELANVLIDSEKIVEPNGMVAVVSFHSLEDRIVKRFFKSRSGGTNNNRFEPAAAKRQATLQKVNRKVIVASPSELTSNPRSSSAKLRIAKRLDGNTNIQPKEILFFPQINLKLDRL